ncbi:MAG: ABC transporter ATP-binding protein [Burkholderiaceae bacterium]
MANVRLEAVGKRFGKQVAVRDVTLSIDSGEFIVLLGPSGCGKTTILRMLGGFSRPDDGRILIDGDDVTNLAPRHRNIGMVFQNYALFPNMTVAENIVFGLRERRIDKAAIARRLDEMLALIRLHDRRDSHIGELSGGQQQRVALARAIAIAPRMLLMDEPMAALDLKLRESMQVELRRIQRELGITTILVTHDQHEAMNLADRIVIMADGAIQQIGTAAQLYGSPANPFVAAFIGKNNLLSGTVTANDGSRSTVELAQGFSMTLPGHAHHAAGVRVEISVRPEQFELEAGDGQPLSAAALPATIDSARFLGNVVHYRLKLPWGQEVLVERSAADKPIPVGSPVRLGWRPESLNVFPAEAGR